MELRVKPNINYLLPAAIEHKANTLLHQYEAADAPITTPPIPIEFIAEDFLGYELVWEHLSDYNTLAFVDPNEMQICFNYKRSDYFDRIGFEFTLAHEIGHPVLGHFEEAQVQFELGIKSEPTRFLHRERNSTRYQRHEIQANLFAGHLLMPKKLLVTEAHQYNLLERNSIFELAKKFKVSFTAMLKRLQELHLVYSDGKNLYRDKQEASGMKRLL